MVDLFFYKKIEDAETAAIEDKAEEKTNAKDEGNWDKREEEGADAEEQWAG